MGHCNPAAVPCCQVMDIKNVRRSSLKDYSSSTGKYVPDERCWNVDAKADIALPCATQVSAG